MTRPFIGVTEAGWRPRSELQRGRVATPLPNLPGSRRARKLRRSQFQYALAKIARSVAGLPQATHMPEPPG